MLQWTHWGCNLHVWRQGAGRIKKHNISIRRQYMECVCGQQDKNTYHSECVSPFTFVLHNHHVPVTPTCPLGLISRTSCDLCSPFSNDSSLCLYPCSFFSSSVIITRQHGGDPAPHSRLIDLAMDTGPCRQKPGQWDKVKRLNTELQEWSEQRLCGLWRLINPKVDQ